MKSKKRKHTFGQSTIEYLLMVAFGAIMSIQIAQFFNGVFLEGMAGLERNVEREVATGEGFRN